ncbi:DNA-binding Lrp family transcriptional regulator [Arthrobacter pigmenti]|uniref:DNA-binding Lrp family transcriptional regulator n=1 Tax=Arthrobacter pigmenti TaxID=271432 RepID=A0A846RER1_9MICC|nr:Lrp/AsnC family transcriptional regulator [Arthrobacter pigmenti]NJC21533.1 DNA-binding Lrp family transcriptional regulator [Arthrobacter pigmenti]
MAETPEIIDTQLIRALQREGRASYQDLARELRLPRATVSARLRSLLENSTVRVVAAVDPAFLGQHVIAHVSVVASGPVGHIAGEIAHWSEAVLVSAIGGTHDLIAEIRVASHDELHALLTQLREHPNVAYIDTLIYTGVVKGFFISQYAGEVSIDDVDTQLIEILQKDGRASYRDLAAAVGLSPTAARTRVQRLLDARIIKISAVEARGAGGRQLSMGVGMNLAGDNDAVLDLLRRSSHVEFVAQTVGRFDAVATLAASSPRELLDQLEQIRSLPGVSRIDSWLHLEVVKEDYARRIV